MRGYEGLFMVTGFDCKEGYDQVENQHITFRFGELEKYPENLMTKTYKVNVVGYGCDGKNEGYLVEIPNELKQFYHGASRPHITVGIANGGKPVDTAKLNFRSCMPFVVYARLGYFDFATGKVVCNEGRSLGW